VRPRLALLTALPWERQAFVRAALDARSDYARRFADDPLAAWDAEQGYAARVAAPVRSLLEHARALGVDVTDRPLLADLHRATCQCDAVVLLAHWKGANVARDDLRTSSTKEIGAALRRASHATAAYDALAGQIDVLAEFDIDGVADCLDRHVRTAGCMHSAGRSGIFPEVAHVHTLESEQRAALEAALSPLLKPGNMLELADGLHGRHAVEDAIASGFDGVLDLTICASSVLAGHIDRARGGACRIVQFTTAVDPESACLALQQTLALLDDGVASDYMTARARAVDDVHAALAGAARARAPAEPEAPRAQAPWWRLF